MARRSHGTGHLYAKHGAYYGRWRTSDGRKLNRKVGATRPRGTREGLTRAQAEKRFRRMQEDEEARPTARVTDAATVSEVADSLRHKLALEGARKSYLVGCASMQRVHVDPRLGQLAVADVTTEDINDLSATMVTKGLKPKSVRNVLVFLNSVFEYAIEKKQARENPVRRADRPKRRRGNDANPDLQFLTMTELDAVIRAIPDDTVKPKSASTRQGRRGSAPPVPPNVLGPVLRVLILVAAMTGLRRSELVGLRWRHVDWVAQRIRVRNAFVVGEHSGEGKSDLSTRRSIPMADRVVRELDAWSQRTEYRGDDDLVFAHPETGNALDPSKVSKRFRSARRSAKVREVTFHDLRHTFGTTLAASGKFSLRAIQEYMGHADAKTTQIYLHYMPSEHEVDLVNQAFARESPAGTNSGTNLSASEVT